MAFKRSGTNPDDNAQGVVSDQWTNDLFTQQEQSSFGASELIKAGKPDRPDDQLSRTIFSNEKQAFAFSALLAKARKYKVTSAIEMMTFAMEALTSVQGTSRRQYLQGITSTYDWYDTPRNKDKNNQKQANTRPIQAGD